MDLYKIIKKSIQMFLHWANKLINWISQTKWIIIGFDIYFASEGFSRDFVIEFLKIKCRSLLFEYHIRYIFVDFDDI